MYKTLLIQLVLHVHVHVLVHIMYTQVFTIKGFEYKLLMKPINEISPRHYNTTEQKQMKNNHNRKLK